MSLPRLPRDDSIGRGTVDDERAGLLVMVALVLAVCLLVLAFILVNHIALSIAR